MKQVCLCCEKPLSVFNQRLFDFSRSIVFCEQCNSKASPDIVALFSDLDRMADIDQAYKQFVDRINNSYLSAQQKAKLISYGDDLRDRRYKERGEIEALKAEQEAMKIKQETILQHFDELKAGFLVTTGYSFDGYAIGTYNGVMSHSVVQGTDFFTDMAGAFSDIWGARSKSFSKKLEDARKAALEGLEKEAILNGANALIGVDFDYIILAGNMLGVVANGTAVTIKKNDNI